MTSKCQRYTIVYNGEIYNHGDIKKQLDLESDRFWRGHSDTEVLLEAISCWGFVDALKKTNGMFAIAVWDHKTHQLLLARDRIGEKPLYYGWINKRFIFTSELKALETLRDVSLEIDKQAMTLYLRFGYVPAPWSIYQGIHKLEPGSYLVVKHNNEQNSKVKKYWNLSDVVSAGIKDPFLGTDDDAVNELEILLSDSIKGRLLSDVPLGAFLSGGIDSTTVVALMQEQDRKSVV
jgi:asparagine synthase (glutamine-hydrolysing)